MRQLSIFKRLTILLIFISFQKLHAQSSVIIGTGTLNTNGSSADPLERYYNYEHFQMVYLASELTAGGMTVGAQITSLGFSVSESASSLVNFSISLGHTTQTVANPYINVTGLTTVKNSFTYSPVAQTVGNFDMITFDTPFIWDGTSNIVVNTCTGSNSFTSPYGGVRYTATSTTGSMRFIRTDATSNCNAATNTNSVNRPNIKFNFNANNTPCTGAPNAFTLLSSATSVCPNSTFTLSVQNPPTEAGISYQWQSKPIGSGTFTTIANAPATSIYTVTAVDGISITAEYTVIAICANSGQSTGSSNSVAVTMNSLLNCYCIPSSTDCTAGDHITNVSFQSAINPINNTTGACLDNTYSDYTSTVTMAEATQGVSIPISVSVNNGGPEYAGVWIDFNQDGDFDDVGEYISITDADNVAPWIFTGNITIPTNASLGITRIRVRSNYNTAILSSDACVTFAYGETEDYLVNILSGCLSPISVSVTNITQTTADVVWTNASSSTVTNWQIEYGPTGFAQGTGTLQGYFGGVGSMVSMANNLAGFTCNTTYDMNVRIQCGSNFSPWTATTFTTQSCAPPIAGTCQATYTNPCNNGSIVLDLSGNSNNSYDNYQWEQSPDGVSSLTDIVGATQPTLTMSCPGLKKFIRNKTFNNAGADYSNPIAIYPCDPIVIGFDSIGNVTCQGKENGKFTIMPSGGSGDYICTITSGFGCCEGKSCLGGNCNNNTCQCEPFIILSTGIVSLSNLSAGKYYVKLKDSFSPCEVTDSIVISEPDTVKYMGIYTQTIDENNTIHPSAYKIDVSGGTAPFNTYWNNSSISNDSVLLNSAFDSIQFYTVDANGCIDSGMISNVPPPVSIQIDSVEYSTCFGTNNDGFVHTTISSPYSSIIFPYTIEWGNGNTTENLNNAVVPFHKVPMPEISTAGEGIGGVDVGLKKKPGGTLSFGVKGMKWKYKKLTPEKSKMTWIDETDPWVPAPVLKAPGIILDKGTPPFSYQWQDASTLPYFGPACSNTASYSVAITDALGCTIALTEHDTIPLFVNIKVNSLSCNNNNGELEANVCGGFPPYSYLWSNGNTSNQISNLPVGEFSVTITDALGFVAT
ncbi:MAG TPA: GEVED domain-containing protein, partial [Chitinophagaceae bacterium]|nr:GEVED domain-containing protein [Chitinophagaceae bacterium]